MTHLDFGKYAIFIWPALTVTAIILTWMAVDSLLRARYWAKRVRALESDRHDRSEPPKS